MLQGIVRIATSRKPVRSAPVRVARGAHSRARRLRAIAFAGTVLSGYRPRAVDAAPQQAPYVYAATDERPRGDREVQLCDRASDFDWLYFAMPIALDAGTI